MQIYVHVGSESLPLLICFYLLAIYCYLLAIYCYLLAIYWRLLAMSDDSLSLIILVYLDYHNTRSFFKVLR